ncbi:tRNA guanosine(34) transglycosylase Tgt [Candidatus Woesearchaeota archaeon]|nr:tRNA guanosine(34) transglycosylase Tgt [Candidatus Woesearchaeota archaeon]
MTFKIIYEDKKTKARIGKLKTKSGTAETPFFMPVATRAATKGITVEELYKMGVQTTISNALILYLRQGSEIIKKAGGIKKFMNWKGLNFTDCGGFQMYSKNIYLSSSDKGVLFKNPINGEKLFITPEKDMEIQLDIGSDVAMSLDSMPLYNHTKKQIMEAGEKTKAWAKRCKIHHDNLQKEIPKNKKQLLFGIIQGGIYEDLREDQTKSLMQLDFDGYSIGGFGLGETIEEEFNAVKVVKNILPKEKPVYLMGIGTPIEILKGIELGVDVFDSRMPTQSARRGTLFTWKGKIKILNEKYKFDYTSLDEECDCFVCKNYTKAFLRYQLINNEPLGQRLAMYHNVYFLTKLIEKAKEQIKKNKFKEFKEKFEKDYKN